MRDIRRITTIFSIAWLLSACQSGDQQILENFLNAVQRGDETTADSLSVVEFPTTISSWEVVKSGTDSVEPFRLAEYRQNVIQAKKSLETHYNDDDYFVQGNEEHYVKYKKATEQDPEVELSGALGEFQLEWNARQEKRKELETLVSTSEKVLESERNSASKSIRATVSEKYQGEVTIKEVQVKVNSDEGEKIFTLELRRYNLENKELNLTPMTSWIISDIKS